MLLSQWFEKLNKFKADLSSLPKTQDWQHYGNLANSQMTNTARFNKKLSWLKQRQEQELVHDKQTTASLDPIVTVIDTQLSNPEISILSKGPKFALKPKLNNKAIDYTMIQFAHTCYQLRWGTWNRNENTGPITHPGSNDIKFTPPDDAHLINKLKTCQIKIKDILQKAERKSKFMDNITQVVYK